MANQLAQAIKDKMAAEGLNVSQAVEKSGINPVSFANTLRGKSKPNSRGVGAWSKWLGVEEGKILEWTGKAPEPPVVSADGTVAAPAGKRRGRPPGSGKGKGGRKRVVRDDAMPAGQMAMALRVLSDGLAVKVAQAPAETRAIIAKLLA
jgi:hypothetical protein